MGHPTGPVGLDPFASLPFATTFRTRNSWWIAASVPVAVLLLIIVAWAEGALGTWADWQLFTDAGWIIRANVPDESLPRFPLMRDYAGVIVTFAVFATAALLHRQWQLITAGLPALRQSGAVSERTTLAPFTRLQRLTWVKKLLVGAPATDRIEWLVTRTNKGFERIGRFLIIPALLSVALTAFLIVGPLTHGFFDALQPSSLDSDAASNWREQSYLSWWAGTSKPFGFAIFLCVCFLGILLIAIQVMAGLVTLWFLWALIAVANFDADWTNQDDCFGWLAVGRIMRTVRWSLALHGLTLSIGIALIGVRNVPWILGLVIIWVVTLPTFAVLPTILLRRVQHDARSRRITAISFAMSSAGVTASDIINVQPYRTEIEYANRAKIRPHRVKVIELPAFIVLILLPAALTFAQIYVPLAAAKP